MLFSLRCGQPKHSPTQSREKNKCPRRDRNIWRRAMGRRRRRRTSQAGSTPDNATPRHATPPPPARSVPWRHPPPARRARALYRGDPRGLHRTRPATRTATARSLPRSPRIACLSPARARRDMRAPRPRLAFSMCRVKAQGGRCRVAEPSARPVAVARFSLDTVMIALPSGSSCSCLCGQLNNSGSRSFFARPESRPNPIAG